MAHRQRSSPRLLGIRGAAGLFLGLVWFRFAWRIGEPCAGAGLDGFVYRAFLLDAHEIRGGLEPLEECLGGAGGLDYLFPESAGDDVVDQVSSRLDHAPGVA